MRTESWLAVDRLLGAALERPPAERGRFLDQACAGDRALRRKVEALLDADARAAGFLAQPLVVLPAALGPEPADLLAPGQQVGPYRVVRRLGRGGTSIVYLARRDDGRFDKEVAVKVLDHGRYAGPAVERFRVECRILAGLEHPSIARLYDAGNLEDGTPYVVMEYVDGERIDTFCRRLRLEARLRLFRQVCAAVHFAHRHLVVHRDLKPGNILVTGGGVPKLLDFGIAKLIAPDSRAERSEATLTWFQPMTPLYASPEQLLGERVTTATDVYALGLLLYCLLTGGRPERPEGRSLKELERFLIARESLCRPSQAVAKPLRRRLAGDLDSIVLKTLSRDPQRRYSSAERLADDLERHLSGRPVTARAGTLRYRASRFVRRHRLGLGVAAAFLALVIGSAVSAAHQAARLRAEHDKLERTSSFFFELFDVSPPDQHVAGGSVTAREILERGVRRIDAELGDSPAARAAMLDTLGRLFTALGSAADAEPLVEEGLALRRRLYGADHPEIAASLINLAAIQDGLGHWPEAAELYRRALDMRRRHLGDDHPAVAEAHGDLGMALVKLERFDQAEAELRRALDIHRAGLPPRPARIAAGLADLGHVLVRGGQLEEAQPLLEEALALRRQALPAGHPDFAESLFDLAEVAHKQGQLSEAEQRYRESAAIYEAAKGPDHPRLVVVLSQLAQTLEAAGKLAEAERLFRRLAEINRRTVGEEHPDTITTWNNLAVTLRRQGKLDQAEALLRRALEARIRVLGEGSSRVAQSRHTLASVLHQRGDLEAAEALYRVALAGTDAALPPGHRVRAYPRMGLAAVLVDRGRIDEAERLARAALALLGEGTPPDHWRRAEADGVLGACLAARGRYPEADRLLSSSHQRLAALRGADDHQTAKVAAWLARLRTESGQ